MDVKEFYKFLYKRQLIWHKKEILKLPAPWSDDEILQKYIFCNCYRENDASSKHLINHVINTSMRLDEKVFNIIWFRFFNTRNFFDINPPRHWGGFEASDYNRKIAHNSAIHACGRMYPGSPFWKQILMVMELEVKPKIIAIARQLELTRCLTNYFSALKGIKGLGDFLKFQCAQDIAYCIGASDWHEAAHIGPGAKFGIELLFPSNKKKSWDEYGLLCLRLTQLQKEMMPMEWQEIYYKRAYYPGPWLSMANIQHSLCEFRKYINLSKGIGRKRYYKKGE